MNQYLAAMKQALEALEFSNKALEYLGKQSSSEYRWNLEAAANLSTSIAKMEKAEPIGEVRPNPIEGYSDVVTMHKEVKVKTNLYAHPQQTIPEGWQLVPKEPTPAMAEAGVRRYVRRYRYDSVYKAMLAAAPKLEEMK